VVQALDTDGNGKLDYNEFLAAFQRPNNLANTYTDTPSTRDDLGMGGGAGGGGSGIGDEVRLANEIRAIMGSALGKHATSLGIPASGLIKGNAAKKLKNNMHRSFFFFFLSLFLIEEKQG